MEELSTYRNLSFLDDHIQILAIYELQCTGSVRKTLAILFRPHGKICSPLRQRKSSEKIIINRSSDSSLTLVENSVL